MPGQLLVNYCVLGIFFVRFARASSRAHTIAFSRGAAVVRTRGSGDSLRGVQCQGR